MKIKQIVIFCLLFPCCVCIAFGFPRSVLAEDSVTEACVWNTESYRVMLYETSDLTNSSIYYCPYLLNGFPVRIQEWSGTGNSVCISFLDRTFWIDSQQLCMAPPKDMSSPVFRSVAKNICIASENEGIIPVGTQVEIRGYTHDAVIIEYNGKILEIDPASIQLIEITYEAPEYLLSQAEIIDLCKHELMRMYGLTISDIDSMQMEFVSYSTLSSPALYIVRFYTEVGEMYTLHCDGEYGIVIDSHFSPYAVG